MEDPPITTRIYGPARLEGMDVTRRSELLRRVQIKLGVGGVGHDGMAWIL